MAKDTDGYYYFNRCRRCNGLITKLQLLKALGSNGEVCPCGSGMFGPTNPVRSEWRTWPVIKMAIWQMLGLLAPAPEPGVMPHLPELAQFTGSQSVTPLSVEEREFLRGDE